MMKLSRLARASGLMARTCGQHPARLMLSLALFGLAGFPAGAADDFYKGKSLKLIISDVPGGGYEAYSRLIARHMGKYIPGQPNIIAVNMPGADGLIAGNYLFNKAERDGTVIGGMNRYVAMMPLLGNTNAKFKANEFQWLGTGTSYASDSYILIIRSDLPQKTVDDLRDPARPLNIGSIGTDVPIILKETLGLTYKIIGGYKGKQELELAIERGELDGTTLGYASLESRHEDWIKKGSVRPMIQFGRIDRLPVLADVPTARELAKTPDDRALIEFAELPLLIARPFAAPPGTPPELVAVLRKAFMQAVNDPDYIAEGTKQMLEMTPKSGEEVQALVANLEKITPAVIERYKTLIGRPGG
jgi:tripartite-type tricarboxylate transporter receptor subunit TctC